MFCWRETERARKIERARVRGGEKQSIRKRFDGVRGSNKPDLRFEYNFNVGKGNKALISGAGSRKEGTVSW